MLKLLLTSLIIYFIYRFFIKPIALNQAPEHKNIPDTNNQDEEGEYIDYEEVD